MNDPSFDCAKELLEAVPLVMQAIRVEMRSRRTPDLTVPQFRTMVFLNKFPGTALSDLAEYVGLSLPSMSKMIDGLVGKGLVSREGCARDRRRIALALTPRGKAILRKARQGTQEALAGRIGALSQPERQDLLHSLKNLRLLFLPDRSDDRS